MKLLFLILKIIGGFGATFTGVYLVSGMAMENVVLKQDLKNRSYNDSLETVRQKFVEETAARYEPSFTLEEQAEVTERIVNDGIKSIKRFVNNENRKQEEQFEVVYFMDDQDSTFKLLTYKVNGKYMVVRQIPISTSEFNAINN